VRIETGFREAERQAFVRVLDSGPGPSAEIESKLFEPFATSKPEGVGLGLAVARQIARAHGGELQFSRNGEGVTCFELRLPLA
jgi:signal transduction histidine kinase